MYLIEFGIGDIVYLKTDIEKAKRICTGISIRANGISYELSLGSTNSWHYDFEIDYDANRKQIGFKN